jgi:cell fate regulator YaaT (PSP1 superfamily)
MDSIRYPRGTQVICRTRRGLEVGEVLSPVRGTSCQLAPEGRVLRAMTPEDKLLQRRLSQHLPRAFKACQTMLADKGVSAVLMDVEHLFDGKSLYFYFLGEVTAQIEVVTAELARMYDRNVQFRRFAEMLSRGCGPGCGTSHAKGGGCEADCDLCAAGCGRRPRT